AAATMSDVVLTDELGGGLTFGAVTSAGGFIHDGTNAPIHVFTLPAGASPGTHSVTYTATVNQDAVDEVGNSVTAIGGGDPDDPDAPDPACPSCQTGHDVGIPSLELTKTGTLSAD